MRRSQLSNSSDRSPIMIESLETRRLLSTVLGPSAVEGTYKGDVDYNGGVHEVKIVITATTETLTIVGTGTKEIDISSKQFKKLREGAFSYTKSVDGVSATLTGTVTKAGAKISGDFSGGTSGDAVSGTFVLKKVT